VSEAKGRFLVIRGGAIGDFILTLPVFAAIREMFPNAHIEVLGYPNVTPLAVAGGAVDGARNIDARPLASYFIRKGESDAELKDYFGSFHVVISYLYDPDGYFQNNVKSCGEIQFIQGPHRPGEDDGCHAADVLLKPLEQIAIFVADSVPRLSGIEGGSDHHDVAVHPGSGSESKNWPIEQWSVLLNALAQENKRVLVIGGEADGPRIKHLKEKLNHESITYLECAPLTEVASALRSCGSFIGHDSGIAHLAAALGLPGISLWGETNQTIWAPRSDSFKILKGGAGLAGIDANQVLNSLKDPDA
tara:strand:+ start:9525 stop:10436 length:912 start_codon:yes stop_codon:yes gene_type:complete